MLRVNLRAQDQASARLDEIAAMLANPQALYKDVGRRGATELRKHFTQLDRTQPNKLGGPRTHFWLDVRNATGNPELEARGVSITISHLAFALQVHGGTVFPREARALTIPLHPLAHGRRASVFEEETGFKLFRPKSKNPRFARLLMAEIDDRVVPIYKLASSATIHADPHALPEDEAFGAAIMDTAEKHFARKLDADGT